jgi:hypothetical protein
MSRTKRRLSGLTIEDLAKDAVWEMIEDPKASDVMVRPVKRLPVRTMRNRLAATQLRLTRTPPIPNPIVRPTLTAAGRP